MRTPDFIIKIAADSLRQLRRIDVYRVLDNCTDIELHVVATYISSGRPDLSGEVTKCIQDIREERDA